MVFKIRMGLPEMAALWKDLSTRKPQGKLDSDEEKFFKKLAFLSQAPLRHQRRLGSVSKVPLLIVRGEFVEP